MSESPSPAFSLRPAAIDDLSKIIEIENHVHKAPWTREHFEAEITKPFSHFLVLSDDETDSIIAGYIVFWVLGEQAEVLNVVVDLPFRGLGFARMMIRKAAGLAVRDGKHRLVLDVRKSNKPAIQLYQSIGFTITQVRKSFYSDGEDAYGMTLPLDERFDDAAGFDF